MDLMEIRRRLMMMGGNAMIGIKQVAVQPNDSFEVVISVPERPYGFLIGTDDESVFSGGNTVIRACGLWTTYSGGTYAGNRYVAKLINGNQDHWAFSAGDLYYDETNHEFHVKAGNGYFRTDRKYWLWYFTIPF